MIGYLMGEVLENAEGKLLIGVGDRKCGSMVGYSVSVPFNASYGDFCSTKKIELFVYTHVREEAFDLYGFQTQVEKTLFLTLLSVNGIGPKSALGILSAVEPNHLIQAIIQGDQVYLTQIPGIGKKTAERVVVELRDSVKKKVEQGLFVVAQDSSRASLLSKDSIENALLREAKEALIGLGYREQEVHQWLARVMKDESFQPKKTEDVIRVALRQLV